MLKDASANPVIPQLQPLAEANSDLSDSDLDDMLDPGHAGEDYQGGLIEESTENRERLVGASLAAELNTTAGIAAEFAVNLNVSASISGKPTSVTHSTLCTYNYEYSFTSTYCTYSPRCCRAWECSTS